MTDSQEQLEFELGIKAPPPPDREVKITAAGTPSGVHRGWTGRTAQMSLRLTQEMVRRYRQQAVKEGLNFNSLFAKCWLFYLAEHPDARPDDARRNGPSK